MAFNIFGAIDIGSYEIRLKILEISKKNRFREVNDVRYRLEMGTESYSVGTLSMETVDKICAVLLDFKRIMADFGVGDYRACATSVFRELKNPLVVVEQIFVRTGIHIDILSNAEQHFLGYKSIAAIEMGFKKMIAKGTAILDVGGGSLQVSLFDKDALVTTQSLKIGSMRIRERLRDLEKKSQHYDQLISEYIRNDIESFQRLFLKEREIQNVILLGDFLTDTLFREVGADNVITKAEFISTYDECVSQTELQLAQSKDMEVEMASLIIPNLVIIKSFIEIFNAEALWMPGVSINDGLAYDYAEKNKIIKSTHDFENDILVAARNIAKRYSSAKNHIQGTTALAMALFDGMKKVHGMGQREALLLRIAVQLHDVGKYISIGDVAENSYQIIMSTEIIGLSTLERHIIAAAVRYNNIPFDFNRVFVQNPGISPEQFLLVAKLTAILKLANALDRSHYQKIKALRTTLKDRELTVIMDSEQDVSLELGLLEDKVSFFEEIFGVRLILKRKRIK